ncbi:MAG: hypothetical protein GY710_08700 [Desulfobacteraceae bacterium]|nr:hypothetical protein [Desulfobacteraceae bacterium]
MAKKKIVSIGLELASDDVKYVDFSSNISLLDWDIILFKPFISDYIGYGDTYQGKPSLSERGSFELKEHSEHWCREIKDAVDSDKVVFIFLDDLEEVYIDTGQREYSGTGRNKKTTRIVSLYDNYKSIPMNISPIRTNGKSMKLHQRGSLLASYWKNFEKWSSYKIIISVKEFPGVIVTKNGDKPVGGIIKNKNSSGAVILLPDIDFYHDSFFVENEETGKQDWTKETCSFAAKIIKEAISINKAIKNDGNSTPEPEWSKSSKYDLDVEQKFKSKLLIFETKINELHKQKEKFSEQLKDAGRLRNLLYENGKPLEYAILDALSILGFTASQYRDSESEFDVVFECDEGRLIGEAEGKDRKAINIDKLRQLEMNILEDLDREGTKDTAKAVLFGNPQRFFDPKERDKPFTKKCLSAANRSSTALIFTPDLFRVTQYLSNNRNKRFATKCRKAILNTVGIVIFPVPPKPKKAKLKSI